MRADAEPRWRGPAWAGMAAALALLAACNPEQAPLPSADAAEAAAQAGSPVAPPPPLPPSSPSSSPPSFPPASAPASGPASNPTH